MSFFSFYLFICKSYYIRLANQLMRRFGETNKQTIIACFPLLMHRVCHFHRTEWVLQPVKLIYSEHKITNYLYLK